MDSTITTGGTKNYGVKAFAADGSDQTAQLASGAWTADNGLLVLATQDAAGLIESATAGATPGTTTVTVDAADAKGNHFTATVTITITAPEPPAIDHVEIVELD